MLRFAEVSLGEGGTTSCRRCDPSQPEALYRTTADIVAEARAAVASWAEGPGPNVALTGAEPFGHPELPSVVAAVVGAGVKRLRLDTDAVALVVPENAAGVLAAGLRHLGVTLLAGTAAVHDVLAGRAGLLDATREGLARVTSEAERAGVPLAVSARVPVCRHNVRDLPSAVLAAVQAGCGHVVLEIDDGGLDLAGALPWITAACDSGTVNSVWVEVSGLPLCLAGGHVLHAVPVLRPAYEGARPAACVDCRLDALCEGAPPGVAPDVAAAIAPPEQSERLEAAIRRAYLDPGPGEVE